MLGDHMGIRGAVVFVMLLQARELYFVEGQKINLFLPRNQRTPIMKRFHEGLGHLAFDSLIDLIKARFWWPNLRTFFSRFFYLTAPNAN